jgi:hypothetical protein
MTTEGVKSLMKLSKITLMNLRQHGLKDNEIHRASIYFQSILKPENAANWDGQFIRYALRQHYKSAATNKPILISGSWKPSNDVIRILISEGVSMDFIEERIPEFRIYWQDIGEIKISYSATFLKYIRKGWSYHNDVPMNKQWTPAPRIIDYLISRYSITTLALNNHKVEFKEYWSEIDIQMSRQDWDDKFRQYVQDRVLIGA